MDDEELYQLLVELMERLSIKVVRKSLHDEEFKISGGLCKIRGDSFMILDKKSGIREQNAMLIRGLAECNLEDHFVPPLLRELIEQSRCPSKYNPLF